MFPNDIDSTFVIVDEHQKALRQLADPYPIGIPLDAVRDRLADVLIWIGTRVRNTPAAPQFMPDTAISDSIRGQRSG